MTDLDKRAYELLNYTDSKFYTDMTDPLKVGIAHVVSVEEDGVLLKAKNVLFFNALSEKRAVEIASEIEAMHLKDCGLFQHDNVAIEKVSKIVGRRPYDENCHLAVAFRSQEYEIDTDLQFEKLNHDYDELVSKTYGFFKNEPNRLELAHNAVENGLWGGFRDLECVGFIGTHEEGTMGMLEILEKYRNRGYGRALEQLLANEYIKAGRFPYCHILEKNTASLNLQKSMGFWLSEDRRIYWFDS